MSGEAFISELAKKLDIMKGNQESFLEWYCRVVYSAIGRMSLVSLVNGDDVSVTSFKRGIKNLQEYYLKLFPEIKIYINDLSEILYKIYLSNGYFYHSSNWLHPAILKTIKIETCSLVRGDYLTENIRVSGLGMYNLLPKKAADDVDICEELILQPDYEQYVKYLINNAEWQELKFGNEVEYLQLKGYWSKSYWKSRPDMDGSISLLRIGNKGISQYFLYRYRGDKCLVSALSDDMVLDQEYISIACGLLLMNNNWPQYEVKTDGDIVNIKLNYLLPPALMNWLKLYSWPAFKSFNSDEKECYSNFERIMNKNIYDVFARIMVKIGLKWN